MPDWKTTASIATLQKRAAILRTIRHFFETRNVLEVDTPTLSQGTVTDVHLEGFSTAFHNPLSPDVQTLYLQTSPEFAMKRLLCSGVGSIYQICKAYRDEEAGRFHNPEFTMLEWYRVGFDHLDLMDEIDVLVQQILGCEPAERMTYQSAFELALGIDPLSASVDELKEQCSALGYAELVSSEDNKDTLLHLLFSHHVEPVIGQQRPVLVYEFPASQAALARIDGADPRVASRFELYFKGIELANGFHELSDAEEQAQRFVCDNQQRRTMNLPQKPIDRRFLAGLEEGLPDCAGVAMGLDRLVMLAVGADKIDEVLTFPVNIA